MRRGVTLLELIFVLVIIGVLTGIGFYAFRPHYLQDDTSYVAMRLKQIKYEAIGYDRHIASLGEPNDSIGCFSLEDLNDTHQTRGQNPYRFHSDLNWNSPVQKLCFDEFGRLHQKSYDGTLLQDEVNITLSYKDEERNILIDPWSGCARVR